MSFEEWWIEFRGFDDPLGKEGARLAFDAGVSFERERLAKLAESVEGSLNAKEIRYG